MTNCSDVGDILGIGFGPSNIALAVAIKDSGFAGNVRFLETDPGASWQQGMLLEHSDIQHNPLRDFSTPVNPRGQFTFCNFLHETGKFFRYLNLGMTYAYRVEFAEYVAWVKRHFEHQVIADRAIRLSVELDGEPIWKVTGASGATYACRHLVVGTGRPPRLPRVAGLAACPRMVHLSNYLHRIGHVDTHHPVVVVGASQSSAEIVLDLIRRGFSDIHLVHRSFSFQLKDTSPFSDEVYFPEFIDYFHSLDPAGRRALGGELRRTNYSSVDRDVLEQLYRSTYVMALSGKSPLTIHRNCELVEVTHDDDQSTLTIKERYKGDIRRLPYQLAILATGFLDIGWDGKEAVPPILADIADQFAWDGEQLRVSRHYGVEFADQSRFPSLFLNGLCEATHGMGDAGSFSLLSLRARDILAEICSRSSERLRFARSRAVAG